MPVPMELSRILIRETQHEQLIELRESDPQSGDARTIPIVIGMYEAAAIGRRLDKLVPPRPLTHDLLGATIEALGASVDAITLTDIVNGAFIADITLTRLDGTVAHVDARPSDALALGVLHEVPIFAEEHVLEAAVPNTDLDVSDDF